MPKTLDDHERDRSISLSPNVSTKRVQMENFGSFVVPFVVQQFVGLSSYDSVTSTPSCDNGIRKETLEFKSEGVTQKEFDIVYGNDSSWSINQIIGSLLLEDGFHVLKEDGFKIKLES